MKTPEESVKRYTEVVKLVKQGYAKSAAYEEIPIDRNTICNQAHIAS